MKLTYQFQIVSLFAFLDVIWAASVGKLPPTFKVCRRSNPQLDKCVESAVQSAIQDLVKGYPPLGIYSVDPLEILAIDIDQGTGPVSINLKFRNLKIYGFKNARVSNLKVDLSIPKITAKAKFGKIMLKGKYIIDGKVLILPIKGDGDTVLTLDDVTADVEIVGKDFKRDGKIFVKITKFGFKLDTKKLSMKFQNLFNGDKALGDNMNRFLNENWSEILNELKPAIQDTFGAAFAEISNRIFTRVPFTDIFPN